jgi:hypothetical protein
LIILVFISPSCQNDAKSIRKHHHVREQGGFSKNFIHHSSYRRTFINLFIIDPKKRLDCDHHYTTSDLVQSRLLAFVREHLNRQIPKDVMEIILSFAGLWNHQSALEVQCLAIVVFV